MKILFLSFFFSLLLLLAIDGAWLYITAKRFYNKHVGSLMAAQPKKLPAAFFYLLYALGITLLVVMPAIQGDFNFLRTFFFGALLGLVAYGTYDLTNQATLKEWPLVVTLVDLVWGALLTGVVSMAVVRMVQYFA